MAIKKLSLFLLLFFAMLLVQAQQFANKDLQSLVDAERAFSRMAKDKNTREAFLANLIDESISFSPGITNAKPFWEKLPITNDWLYWQPVYADIAASGDFGYTTGPWSYSKTRTTAPTVFGEYITVWRKQADGKWKVLIDAGINHDSYDVDGHTIHTSTLALQPGKYSSQNFKDELTAVEEGFTKEVPGDVLKAYTHYASKEIKLYRQNKFPSSAVEEVCKTSDVITFTPEKTIVASSGDMGFTYGIVNIVKHDATGMQKTNNANYLRIWKKENGVWKIVIDLIT
jgi:ketosteroid isomerase-like protein